MNLAQKAMMEMLDANLVAIISRLEDLRTVLKRIAEIEKRQS